MASSPGHQTRQAPMQPARRRLHAWYRRRPRSPSKAQMVLHMLSKPYEYLDTMRDMCGRMQKPQQQTCGAAQHGPPFIIPEPEATWQASLSAMCTARYTWHCTSTTTVCGGGKMSCLPSLAAVLAYIL